MPDRTAHVFGLTNLPHRNGHASFRSREQAGIDELRRMLRCETPPYGPGKKEGTMNLNRYLWPLLLLVAALCGVGDSLTGQIPLGTTTLVSPTGERIPYQPTEPGGWQVIEWTGNEYVVGMHNGDPIVAKIVGSQAAGPDLLYISTIVEPDLDAAGGGETHQTSTWSCTCHPGVEQKITTKITTKYTDEDLRRHDKKLEKALLRHPPVREQSPEPPASGQSKVPDTRYPPPPCHCQIAWVIPAYADRECVIQCDRRTPKPVPPGGNRFVWGEKKTPPVVPPDVIQCVKPRQRMAIPPWRIPEPVWPSSLYDLPPPSFDGVRCHCCTTVELLTGNCTHREPFVGPRDGDGGLVNLPGGGGAKAMGPDRGPDTAKRRNATWRSGASAKHYAPTN